MKTKCPICGLTSTKTDFSGTTAIIHCDVCGLYEITCHAAENLQQHRGEHICQLREIIRTRTGCHGDLCLIDGDFVKTLQPAPS